MGTSFGVNLETQGWAVRTGGKNKQTNKEKKRSYQGPDYRGPHRDECVSQVMRVISV